MPALGVANDAKSGVGPGGRLRHQKIGREGNCYGQEHGVKGGGWTDVSTRGATYVYVRTCVCVYL